MTNKKSKKRFTQAERYAVWQCGDHKCWLCLKPIGLFETTVDHILPEQLLGDDTLRDSILLEWGLPLDFNINDYANWAPAHSICNSQKGNDVPPFIPAHHKRIKKQILLAAKMREVALSVETNAIKGNVLNSILSSLIKQKLNLKDFYEFMHTLTVDPTLLGIEETGVFLDTGFWLPEAEIAVEGFCECERSDCLGHDGKVYCYFSKDLSCWVQTKKLYRNCYDEEVLCSRCGTYHSRGHIGRLGTCARPYCDQSKQTDQQVAELGTDHERRPL